MSEPRPLTAAAFRLRGKPGRPPMGPQACQTSAPPAAPQFMRVPEDPVPGLFARLLDLGARVSGLSTFLKRAREGQEPPHLPDLPLRALEEPER